MRFAATVALKAFEHMRPGAAGLPSPDLDLGLQETHCGQRMVMGVAKPADWTLIGVVTR